MNIDINSDKLLQVYIFYISLSLLQTLYPGGLVLKMDSKFTLVNNEIPMIELKLTGDLPSFGEFDDVQYGDFVDT